MSRIRPISLLAALATICSLLAFATPIASAQVVTSVDTAAQEAALLTLHNQARAADGDAALVRNSQLDAIAREWAQHMANTNSLVHRTDYLSQIRARVTSSPSSWGENVAFGEGVLGTAQVAHDGFMNSSGHRRNILDGAYNQVGIGMVWQNGTLWTAVNFLEAPIDAGQTTPSPAPAPAPSAPVNDPAPIVAEQHAVTTFYTGSEYASVLDAATYLGMSPAELQAFGVHVLRFLNHLAGVTGGTSPVRVIVPAAGERDVTSVWSDDDRDTLSWVTTYYQLTDSEAQKAGAALMIFLVGVDRSLRAGR